MPAVALRRAPRGDGSRRVVCLPEVLIRGFALGEGSRQKGQTATGCARAGIGAHQPDAPPIAGWQVGVWVAPNRKLVLATHNPFAEAAAMATVHAIQRWLAHAAGLEFGPLGAVRPAAPPGS